jgi:hypothetical protein
VHLATHTVAAEIQVDAITVPIRDVTDSSGNVADRITHRRRGDAGYERLFGGGDDSKVLRVGGAGNKTDR